MRRRLRKSERQVLGAVATTLIPDTGKLPAAESEIDVVAPISGFLEGAPSRQLAKIRMALWALELSTVIYAGLRRFSRLSIGDREQHLRRLERSRVATLREIFVMLKGLTSIGYCRAPKVQMAIDYSARCSGPPDAGTNNDRARLEPDDLGPVGEDIETDIVVVGSGAGGAVAAYELARQGHMVSIIEAGSYYDSRSFSRDPIHALSTLYRDSGLTVLEGRPIIPLPIGKCVGGTTLVNSGTCFRASDDLLEAWRTRFGAELANPDLLGPVFDDLESELLIRPVDTETMGRNGQLCMEGAASLGASGGPIKRYANGCDQCGACPYGCPLDLKQATHVSYVPKAVQSGAKLYIDTQVERVIVKGGKAFGVDISSTDASGVRREHKVRSKAVVLAGGAVGTPEILMRSGLKEQNKNIGGQLRVHPACWVGARYSEDVRGWDGVMQSFYVDQWKDLRILMEATFTPLPFAGPWLPGVGNTFKGAIEGFAKIASIGVHLSDRSYGRVKINRYGDTVLGYRLVQDDVRRVLFGIARAADIHFAAGAVEVYPHVGNIDRIKPGQQQSLENSRFKAKDLKLEAFHPMGTARIGPSSHGSVTDGSGEVHGVEDLYVSDASLFPTSLGVNPMLTIMALASLIGRSIAERYI